MEGCGHAGSVSGRDEAGREGVGGMRAAYGLGCGARRQGRSFRARRPWEQDIVSILATEQRGKGRFTYFHAFPEFRQAVAYRGTCWMDEEEDHQKAQCRANESRESPAPPVAR